MKKILCLIILIFISGCTNEISDNAPYVDYIETKYKTIDDNKTYAGYIDRASDVNLSFGLSGVIDGLYALEGDFVRKGEILAKLDNDEYQLNIKKAKTELEDAIVKYNKAKSYYERISKLYSAGGISFNDWETAQTDLKTSTNQIEMLKDALNIAKDKEKFTFIKAPDDGYIVMKYKDDHQYSQAGDKVFLFQGQEGLQARIFVSQNDINKIEVGQRALIQADSSGKKFFSGFVKSRANTSINEGSYRVTVTIEDKTNELIDGMSVNAKFLNSKNNKKILIPINSIVNEIGENYVYILDRCDLDKGVVIKRKVVLGEIVENQIVVEKGLKAHEFVITKGVDKIIDNSKVKTEKCST